MPYSPSTIIVGDTITANIFRERIADFRDELNTVKLDNDDFANATIKTENIARPEINNFGSNLIEFRSESGGVKYLTKPRANLTAIEDDSILTSGTKGDTDFALPSASGKPANSGINIILHKDGLTRSAYDELAPVPGSGMTVEIDEKCTLFIRVKTIFNMLLNNNVSRDFGPANGTGQPIVQYVYLVYKDPDGNINVIPNGCALSGTYLTQHAIHFRQQYLNGIIDIGASSTGTYHFYLVATLRKGSGEQSIFGTHIGLQGRTEFMCEWMHT